MPKPYVRKYAPGTRPKTGGRQKGTPNRSTVRLREALNSAFHDLQEEADERDGHLKAWARDRPGEFYRMLHKVTPEEKQTWDPDWAVSYARASPAWRKSVFDGDIPYPDWMPPLGTEDI